ncbi:MAG: hypothetical protein IKQ05_02300 [Prevotella sp.]|jgi:hypothetical protein|nr:hypothetical protein [Prevotella sp.]
MEKIKSLMLMMLMVFVGGMICSCGSDDDDDNGGGSATGTYTLHCTISDYGTMPEEYAAIMKQGLDAFANQSFPNVTLNLVKAAVDKAIEEAIEKGTYDDEPYNYTIEFYVTDSMGNKVYSRYIVVKDGKATAK